MPATVERVRAVTAMLTVLAVGVLSACGGGSAKTSQVAVKVNTDEITVLQVNQQLAHLPAGIPADQVEPAKRRVIGGLIDQQLLVQQAIERKLDRDPDVLGALEAARLNLLAQAYVQRVIAPQAKPTEQEIRKYYADNPALFAERKVFRLQELSIEANPDQAKEIQTAAAEAKSLKQLAEFLHQRKIPFSADSGLRTAEQLPLSHLPQIAQLKSGSVLVFDNGNNHVSALEVLASAAQPVDDKKAAPVIEQFLANRKRDELSTSEVKRLRDAAKVQYVGDFAKYAADVPATVPSPVAQKSSGLNPDKGIAALH